MDTQIRSNLFITLLLGGLEAFKSFSGNPINYRFDKICVILLGVIDLIHAVEITGAFNNTIETPFARCDRKDWTRTGVVLPDKLKL